MVTSPSATLKFLQEGSAESAALTSSKLRSSSGMRLSSPRVLPGCVKPTIQLGYSPAGFAWKLELGSAAGCVAELGFFLPAFAAKPVDHKLPSATSRRKQTLTVTASRIQGLC